MAAWGSPSSVRMCPGLTPRALEFNDALAKASQQLVTDFSINTAEKEPGGLQVV